MTTFRRDVLRRRIERGGVTLVGSYHFDDQTGSERTSASMPVALVPDPQPKDWWKQRVPGTCYIYPSDFTGSGSCWINPDGTVTLYVHSNSNYTFRLPAPKASPTRGGKAL